MDEIVEFQSASQWDKWLAENFSKSKGNMDSLFQEGFWRFFDKQF